MQNDKIKSITFTGMFAALIFLATWAVHIPAGINGGYIHLGDALVYAAAAILPLPNAMLAAAIGAGLSDLMTPGAAIWILPTIIIKPLCCLPFTSKTGRILCRRNAAAMLAAGAVTTLGYGIATAFIAGSAAVAVAEIPFSLTQAAGSAVCFVVTACALDKAGIKLKVSQ